MKGHEIIYNITRDEMPDIELVRENCVRQASVFVAPRNRVSFVHKVALVAVIMIVMTVTAVAALQQIGSITWGITQHERDERIELFYTVEVYPISKTFRNYLNDQEWKPLDEGNPESASGLENNPEFSSFDEAAAFFGTQFPQNALLDELEMYGDITALIFYHAERNHVSPILYIHYVLEPAKMIYRENGTDYYGEKLVSLQIEFYAGNEQSKSSHMSHHGINAVNIQNYISPVSGIESVLFQLEHLNGMRNSAVFTVNSLVYQIYYDDECEIASYDTLKAIIDAFVKS
jgi:hypothetical protein